MLSSKAHGALRAVSNRSRAYRFLRGIGPLRRIVHGARTVLQQYRVPAWRVEGANRTDGTPLSIVFAGHLESKNYLAHLAFGDNRSERSLGNTWLWDVWRVGKQSGSDVIVTNEHVPSKGSRSRGFCMPCWVGTETDTQRAAELCRRSGSIKRDLRRLTRSGLTYNVTRDPRTIAAFYDTMYLPYARQAHGDRAMLTSWKEFEAELDHAELMLIQRNGDTIAGHLLVDLGGQRVRARALGIMNGDLEFVRLGAVVAIYFFAVEYLLKKGCRKIHFGGSRPFLKDGVLNFKKKYGATLVDRDQHIFRVRVARYSDGARSFLRDNPFISESDGHYYANFFVDRWADVNQEEFRSEISRLGVAGLTAVRVYDLERAHGPLDEGGRAVEPAHVELRLDGERFVTAD